MPRVRLRDVTLADADLLHAWAVGPPSEFNDFGMPPEPSPRAALARGPLQNERNGMLIIELIADGSPLGMVSWHKINYGPNPESDGWNIGIELLPEARGHAYGGEAQAQLAAFLFETTSANRVEASADVENVAEHALEKAGFVREGVQRGAQFRAGTFHDLVTFARVRDDPT
jgi:RimJ/RimL family protein N-acetyltransferase